MLHDYQASYEPDMSAAIDKEHELIADELGVDMPTALKVVRLMHRSAIQEDALVLGRLIAMLLDIKGHSLGVHTLAIAAGLDQLNSIRSETEVAEDHQCTRALVSHYVIGWRDLLTGGAGADLKDITKIRKKNATRKTYAAQATDPVLEAKRRAAELYLEEHGTD
jgi:hypothetical protein